MWRWLLHNNNKIQIQHRQYLMQLVRNMVYAKTEATLNNTYELLKKDPVSQMYGNFIEHAEACWKRMREWASYMF